MALTSASRALGLQHLNLRLIVKSPSSFTFIFHKLHKAWRKGKSPPSVVFILSKKIAVYVLQLF